MDELSIPIGPTAPPIIDPGQYTVINDLYVALYSLVQQLNRYQGVAKSPNGHYWRIAVDNAGVVSTIDLGTTLPP